MMRQSPKSAFLHEYYLEQKNLERQAVKEFLTAPCRLNTILWKAN